MSLTSLSAYPREKFQKNILLIYMGSIPFVAAFSIGTYLPLPLFAAIPLALSFVHTGRVCRDKFDIIFAILFLAVFFPWIWSSPYMSSKAFRHLAALVAVFFAFYYIPRHIMGGLFRHGNGFLVVCHYYSIVLFLVSVFMVFEFLLANFFDFRLDSVIPYPAREDYQATITAGIQRSRGLAAESGHMALFFDMGLFLSFVHVRRLRTLNRWLFCVVVGAAYISMFSVASFVAVSIGAAFLMMSLFFDGFTKAFKVVFKSVLLVMVVFYLFWDYGPGEYVTQSFLPKLLFEGAIIGSGSAFGRWAAFMESITIFLNYPFGIGFGAAASASDFGGYYFELPISAGHVSLFSLFLVAGGVVAILCFLVIYFGFLVRARRLEKYSRILFASGLSLSLHYLFIGDFYLPFIWFFWALVGASSSKYNAKSASTCVY